MSNSSRWLGIGIAIFSVAIIIGIIFLYPNGNGDNTGPRKYDDFAKCLATNNVTMYGAYWCAHCKSQKEMFGNSFQYVKYVECTEDVALCLENKIEAYPTWF